LQCVARLLITNDLSAIRPQSVAVNRKDSQFEQPSKQPPLPTFGVIIKEQDVEGRGPRGKRIEQETEAD
jgi:hypothetical protein